MWLPSAIFNTCIDIFDRTCKAYDLIKSTHRRIIVWWLQKCKGVASHCKVRQSHTVHIKYIWISIFSMCSSMAIMYLVWRGQYPLLGQSQWLSLPGSLQSLASLYLSPGPAPLLWWSLGLEGHPPYQIYDFFLLLKSAQTIKCQQTCHLCSPQTSHLPACKIFLYLILTCCQVLFWPDMFVL